MKLSHPSKKNSRSRLNTTRELIRRKIQSYNESVNSLNRIESESRRVEESFGTKPPRPITMNRYRPLLFHDIEEDSIPFELSNITENIHSNPVDDDHDNDDDDDYDDDDDDNIKNSSEKSNKIKDSHGTLFGIYESEQDMKESSKRMKQMILKKTSVSHDDHLAPQKIHNITTEYGDSLRVIPSGLKRGETYLQYPMGPDDMDSSKAIKKDRKKRSKLGIDPNSPITEDGYISDLYRLSDKKPFSPEYVVELNRRIDVLESHPDYHFLSLLSAELNLDINEIFVKTSITRAQAAAQALSEQISARALARTVRLDALKNDIEETKSNLALSRSFLESKKSDTIIKDVIDETKEIYKNYIKIEAIKKYQVFLLNIIFGVTYNQETLPSKKIVRYEEDETIEFETERALEPLDTSKFIKKESSIEGSSSTSLLTGAGDEDDDDDADYSPGYNDLLQFSAILHYLKYLSPSSNTKKTTDLLNAYETFKKKTSVSDLLEDVLIIYSALDFFLTLNSTYPERINDEGSDEAEPFYKLISLKREDPTMKEDPDKKNWKKPTLGEEFLGNILKPFSDEIEDSTTYSLDDIKKNINTFLNKDWTEFFNQYVKKGLTEDEESETRTLISDSFKIIKNLYKIESISNIINELYSTASAELGTIFYSLITLLENVKEQFENYDRLIEDIIYYGLRFFPDRDIISNIDYWVTFFYSFKEKTDEYIFLLERRISNLNKKYEELQADLSSRETLGIGSETEGLTSVPITNNPEWALNPINTGILRIQKWATSCIEQGHGHFKRYFTQIGRSSWAKLDRNVIQRDELMGPLFASLCATFVNRASIGNPKRYMRDDMEKERVRRKASIMQDMISLRLVNKNPPRFVPSS